MDLLDHTREELRARLVALGEPPFRGEQLFRWAHGRGVVDVAAMTDLGRPLRERLSQLIAPRPLAIDAAQLSTDGTRKLRLRTHDERFIESVLIPDGDGGAEEVAGDEETDANADATADASAASIADSPSLRVARAAALGRFPRRPKLTQCISSQVGCALDCDFCATAKLGFGRQLTAGGIVGQVYAARALMAGLPDDDAMLARGAARVTNIVFMGMGEPLHNLVEVLRALDILTDPFGLGLSGRRITVSTAGLVPAIARFATAETRSRPNLAVSLNATTDEVRDRIMPINRRWNIAALLDAVRAFPLESRRRVTFEYVLLDGINDSIEDARRLPRLLRGIPTKVNLIPFNPHPLGPYRRPSAHAVVQFQQALRDGGLAVYVRRPRGDDIDAACGQLAARTAEPLVPLRRS